jgi:voltage-gated potassium channel
LMGKGVETPTRGPQATSPEPTADQKRSRNEAALERFEGLIALPMVVLSLAVIPLLVIPLVMDLSHPALVTFVALDWFVWAAFAIEYGARFYLAPYKGAFFRHNLFDLLIVVLPFLRPLRVVRSARALRLLRAGRAVAFMGRGVQSGREILTRHRLHYALLIGIGAVLVGAVMVLQYEQQAAGSNIHSYADALWWAITTVTTVGYGDRYPVTGGGRAVAAVLMVYGVGLIGLLAASFASLFIGRRDEEERQARTDEIMERLERIEAALGGAKAGVDDSPQDP